MWATALFQTRNTRVRGLLCLILAAGSSACLVPRQPLIAPTPVTHGATVVSPSGLNFGIGVGAGLLGQEQENADLSMIRLGWGLGSRVGASIGFYGGTDEDVTGGILGQVKVQGTPFFGGRGLWDVALPVEILLSGDSDTRLSAYVGPRFVHRSFTDRKYASGSLSSSYPGLLAGLHVKSSRIRILAELTVAQLPEGTYRGQPVGGRTTVIPMVEIAFTIGPDQLWPGFGNERSTP